MRLLLLLVGLLAAVAAFFSAFTWHKVRSSSPMTIASQGPTVDRLERLAELVSMRVYIADILTGDGEGYRGAWLIKGDALISVDLSQAQIEAVEETARRATILLPQPAVLQPRVDHSRTKTWEVKRTTWVPWGGNQSRLRDEVMFQAQQLIAHASGREEHLSRARTNAENLIKTFFDEIGWRVQVRWEPAAKSTAGPKSVKERLRKRFTPACAVLFPAWLRSVLLLASTG